jgi:5S rRNA maturation endonuclease (ribonuclease M5)
VSDTAAALVDDDPEPVARRTPAPVAIPPFPPLEGRQAAMVYRYEDEAGEQLFAVGRYDLDEGKTFRQAQLVDGRWVLNLDGVRRVLYRLPAVLEHIAANPREPLYIVEGEKDVHAVEAAGRVATCNPMGAGKWSDVYAEQLQSAHRVIVVADRDEIGRRHAAQVAESLARVGIVAELAEAREGKDAADHLAAGLTLDELDPLELPADSEAPRTLELSVVPVDVFAAAEVANEEPLIGSGDKRLLPAGSTIVFYGEGGSGKTTLTIDLAFHLAAGVDWLGFEIAHPVKVMLLENEGPIDEYRLKIRRKLAAWDGPSVGEQLEVYQSPWGRVDLRDNLIAELLAEQLARLEIDVLIAGPIRRLGLEGGGTPAETVAFMQLLDRVRDAAQRPLAIGTVHHENKGGDISGAFEAEFDTVVHVKPDGRDRTQLVFRKSRWSSTIHRSRMTLAWVLDSEGFGIVESDTDPTHAALERAAEEASALEWLAQYVAEHHSADGTGVARGKAETAYHEAHDNHGRNTARRVIDRQIQAWNDHLNGETTGETPCTLATGPGETKHGTYLYPANHAPSPLAATPNGETGETPAEPRAGAPSRRLADPYKGEASGGETGGEVDQDELERLADIAREATE